MNRRPVLLGLLLLVVCTGCLGPGSPATPVSTPPADDPTPTATTGSSTPAIPRGTTGYTTDCPYYLQVDVATDGHRSRTDETSEYAELPPARQREFEAALANGSIALGDTLPETWDAPRIVTYRDEQYYTVASVC
jgi:hypothetical protein